MNKALNIILSGGGTGGHIYPAIAIANAIKELCPKCKMLFIGANGKMEMEKVPAAGYTIKGIDIIGLQRKITPKNLLLPYYLFKSMQQVKNIFNEFKPDAVIGTGGYVSFPVLFTAQMSSIPTFIQEQNAYAGLANKLLSKKAQKIFVAFDNMHHFFSKDKIILSGNPVRSDLIDIHQKKHEALTHFSLNEKYPTILVLGGSLGAGSINNTIAKNIDYFIQNNIQLIWQMGKNFYSHINSSLSQKLNNSLIRYKDFIYEMNWAYAAADIIVSRAGASTIAELQVVGKPAILIPSPNVTADHQTKNAQSLAEKNAAIIIKDNETGNKLIPQLHELLTNKKLQSGLSQNISQMAKPHAAQTIAKDILNVLS
ncbi:MAG: UDP-N-acetylglucosamine--N-acetylmuramyl-(pentapeptide) pyrophosphoryl-undecaprenol N-acetylglucosamine transferase [Bacteroidia bacterium]|nr:MAG: UDP-N-acetylglucosamine--N-acetylmuramyl-(pentapeptide) pyrophosphoryl-undecaprenol N-acetylglucosamine transferase [Bacteroidia bacterium]